jgi:hypothetical protein
VAAPVAPPPVSPAAPPLAIRIAAPSTARAEGGTPHAVPATAARGTGLAPARPVREVGTGTVTIETEPAGAALYTGEAYAGTDLVMLQRRLGTSLLVRCQLAGHAEGTVRVRFAAAAGRAVCRMQRLRDCVAELKNPFEECAAPGR